MLELSDVADIIAEAVKVATAPLHSRIAALEDRELPEAIPGEQGPQGEQGPAGEVDMDRVKEMIDAAVAALPPAERGEKGDPGEPGAAGENGADGRDGAHGIDGKDGVGLADALIDKDGHLVLTLTDGRTKQLGSIIGKDGRDGTDGKDAPPFTLDDFDIVPTGQRTIEMSFIHGGTKHSFELNFPVMIYRGVWGEGQDYAEGDVCTWGGSLWHCDKATTAKPDAGEWTLCVKKGRDGKDVR
ncbi:hypothetical protein NUH86_10955 [Sphingobium sp. JS3065]|uniref:hypothetical protein n=1 Tax=Sphingobium sp. JS3065 TaxID=2970925 RepID=UPI002264C5BD|nr:hypothetical protein [Sphingobium sp. JS3065]UZW54053.1 hypothetical protein NUH86_10955 [Sphingobium sp. JS3065]